MQHGNGSEKGRSPHPCTHTGAQNLVKTCFNDQAVNGEFELAAINSINWARILAQVCMHAATIVHAGLAPCRVQTATCAKTQSCCVVPTDLKIVYYFHAYGQYRRLLGQEGKYPTVVFSVPTGNFGDILAGYYAKRMGLPVETLIIATNANDIVVRALSRPFFW